MSKRDKVFELFGPKLLECFLEIIFAENNLLRTRLSMPPQTKDQVYDEIINHFDSLPDYDWLEGP